MNSALEQQYLLFRVGDIKACFNLAETLSVINLPKMIRLPSIRGSIIRAFRHQEEMGALVSMRMKFGQAEHHDFTQGRLVLGRVNGRLAGFWVDEVLGITRLSDPIRVEDEELKDIIDGEAIDKVIVHRDERYLHLNMLPFMLFENPAQIEDWMRQKHLEWLERDRLIKEEEEEQQREQERAERIKAREKQQEELQRRTDSLYLDPDITLEYAQGLLEVAEYNEQQRLEEEKARQAEEERLRKEQEEAERKRQQQEQAAEEIVLPELGTTEEEAVEAQAPDAVFEEEQPEEKPKRRILWGARRKQGGEAVRRFKNLRQLRFSSIMGRMKRWANRLVYVVVLLCIVFIFKTIQPALYQQVVDAIMGALGSLEIGQTLAELWHKISSWIDSGS